LPKHGEYPEQTQRVRKEAIYKLSIENLNKGKSWERAIQLMEELRSQYQIVTFDFKKTSRCLGTRSFIFQKYC